MNVVTTDTMQSLDYHTINSMNISSTLLMENAARGCFLHLINRHHKIMKNNNVHIFAGVGGNGGDGLAIARFLREEGYQVHVYIVGKLEKMHADTKYNFNILKYYSQIEVFHLTDEYSTLEIIKKIKNNSLVIDALYGTGLSKPIHGISKILIEELNKNETIKKIAIDIPSGLKNLIDDDNALCFKAHETYTIGLPKDIFFLLNTRSYIGKLKIINSIFPKSLLKNAESKAKLLTKNYKKIKINKDPFLSKREQGMISVIASSEKYIGTSILIANALYRLGVGYIRIFAPSAAANILKQIILSEMPEIVITGVGDENAKYFTENDTDFLSNINNHTACIIGPGIGRDDSTANFVNKALRILKVPTVVDADALFLIEKDTLKGLTENFILTPHIYEFEKMTAMNRYEVLNNPYKYLDEFRENISSATLVLKDAISFLMHKHSIFINNNATHGMGKAGMGDVFAAILGGMLARGLNIKDALIASVFIQNYSFNISSKMFTAESVEPLDVAKNCYIAIKQLNL